ncbi:TPA: hypothetical protein N0F65_011542 [Lagenidium giganteum]|uniref:Probable pectate lyase F n=1 Tax=Lagenidium giganteum TaxID=4803 RepID=A0AAV2Z2J3_9STRA|nr:TPA: hypothetical protein N0F65_011542 [Lagenidium giganteum]
MLQFRKHVTSSLKTQKLLGAIKAAGRPTATRADPQHRKDAANHIQQAYKRHVRAVRDRRLAWQARALRVEERVRRRHHAAKMIQKRVRGMIGRKIARIKRAEQMMRRCIQKLKWKRIRRRIIAGRRIGNWVVRKRAQRLASLWKLEKKRQLEMTVRLQRWVRNHIISRRRLYLLLAEGRRQEETLLFCEQSVRICAQHVADELVMESRGRGFEEALKKHWAITSGTAKTKRTRAPAFPALQMMYLVVSGVRDISKWKEMDEKALVSTRMERLKAVALFKSASKHHQITKQAVTAKTADGDSGNALSPSKVKTKELFSATDVDISMAKAAGSSKRPLSYEEFTHVLRLIAEMKLGDKVQIWWGKYDGGDAQFLALLWKYLFVISDLRPVAQQLMQYANDLLHKRCRTIQRLATKHKQFLTGAFIRLQKRKERELLIKERMAIKIQTRMRSYLAVNKRKRRVQEVYNKFIDAEWGLPYWMNPITGYSTWEKPTILGNQDVNKEPVPCPPAESCGELTKLEFESLAMHNYREQERKEQEERDKHDIVKIKERMLQAKKERCAIKLQKFWHQQSPLMRARRMIKEKRKETDAYYQQYLLDRKKERELRFRAKQFIGKAPILPTDSPVTQCLRRMTVLQRRRLEIRARMFGLLVSEYMLEGVPLPGVGRLRNGGRYIESSEDLRGWVMNRQTLRLRKLEKRRADDDSPKPKDIILDIDRKLKVEERRIPLEQVYNRALSQPEGANVADDAAAEDGVDIFQLFLVEFSMELRRPIWFSHPLYVVFARYYICL